MDAMRNDISESNSLFASLCGLTNFVINSAQLLTINRKLVSPEEVSVLTSLLVSGVQISRLTLCEELPSGTAAELGSAIKRSGVRALTLGSRHHKYTCIEAPELLLTAEVAANSALEQFAFENIDLDFGCTYEWFGQFAALRSLTVTLSDLRFFPTKLFKTMAAGIGRLRALESFYISRVIFADSDGDTLISNMKDLPILAELSICDTAIRAKPARQIGGLVVLGKLKKLDLHRGIITDEIASAIVDAILESPPQRQHSRIIGLQELNLSSNDIGPAGQQKIASELLLHFPRLRSLNLSDNSIGEGLSGLDAAAQSLEELDVSGCGLGGPGVESLLNSTLPTLRALRIGRNKVGDLGARTVSRFLLTHSCGRTLVELQLQENDITESGALALSVAFVGAYELRSLYMSENYIGPCGGATIIDTLNTASTMPMDMIDFAECNIGDIGASAAGRLVSHRGCSHVYLSFNEINAAGAGAIADAVAVSPCRIEYLDLHDNTFGDEGVRYLLDRIMQPRNKTVRKMQIIDNWMGVEGAMAVKRAVESPGVMYRLHAGESHGDRTAYDFLHKVLMLEDSLAAARKSILALEAFRA